MENTRQLQLTQENAPKVFISLLLGQVIFLVFTYFLSFSNDYSVQGNDATVFSFVFSAMAVISIVFGFFYVKLKVNKLGEIPDIRERIKKYYALVLIQLASFEGATFMLIVGFMLTNNPNLFVFTIVSIALFITRYPSKTKLFTALKITENDLDLM